MTPTSPDSGAPSPLLLLGDCADKMRDLAPNSVDAIVTDPPYGLAFMGANWDYGVPGEMFWREALRVAKPGTHLLAFGGTRTYHRLACAIEDAGWEVRDCIMWVYGSGFPKSMDVSKAIDKASGKEGEIIGYKNVDDIRGGGLMESRGKARIDVPVRAPASSEAAAWQGFGTSLKPAVEPIVVARKPLDGTVAHNVLTHGTGALNIDACRVPTEDMPKPCIGKGFRSINDKNVEMGNRPNTYSADKMDYMPSALGRFPANLVHDGSPEVLALFPDSKGQCGAVKGNEQSELTRGIYGKFSGDRQPCDPRGDSGSAARFFYCAKASRAERGDFNDHCTVKPLALMRWLCTLVTPPGGIVLDPFMGSGTTGVAALQSGFRFVGIERDPHYFDIASRRIAAARPTPTQQELPL